MTYQSSELDKKLNGNYGSVTADKFTFYVYGEASTTYMGGGLDADPEPKGSEGAMVT